MVARLCDHPDQQMEASMSLLPSLDLRQNMHAAVAARAHRYDEPVPRYSYEFAGGAHWLSYVWPAELAERQLAVNPATDFVAMVLYPGVFAWRDTEDSQTVRVLFRRDGAKNIGTLLSDFTQTLPGGELEGLADEASVILANGGIANTSATITRTYVFGGLSLQHAVMRKIRTFQNGNPRGTAPLPVYAVLPQSARILPRRAHLSVSAERMVPDLGESGVG